MNAFCNLNKIIALHAAIIAGPFLAIANRPNIIFFITDDMHPYQMNFLPEGQGRNYTPNLDRLAAEGTVMRQQYVSSSVCTPSRYTCLTGRYASRSQDPGFTRVTERLGQSHVEWTSFADPAREKTIAHHLREAGYRTGFVGKDHAILTPGYQKLDLSSDVDDPDVKAVMRKNKEACESAIKRAGFEFVERVYHNNPDFNGSMTLAVHNQDWITEGGLKFLSEQDSRPFFLYFATTIPHGPESADRSWKADRRATPNGWLDKAPDVRPDAASIARRAQENNAEGEETLIWLDDALGALLDKLEETGQLDDTVIVFFNDHGQSAKGSVYQGGVHNPSVVWRTGGWPVGPDSNALVSNIDFVPTLLDMAGAGIPPNVDGISFLPILENRATSIREALFFEMGYTRAVLMDGMKYIALRYPPSVASMTREQRQAELDKMNNNLRARGRPIHTEDPMKPFGHLMPIPGGQDAEQDAIKSYPNYYDSDQFYDLVRDQQERINLYTNPEYKDKVTRLKSLLQEHLKSMPGGFPLNSVN